MPALRTLKQQFTHLLGLTSPPVAVAFCASAPPSVRKFMGQVPSGCSFWKLAASARRRAQHLSRWHWTTTTVPLAGSAHGIDLPPERAHELKHVLGLMAQLGYVKT